jgi:hypothetical protein
MVHYLAHDGIGCGAYRRHTRTLDHDEFDGSRVGLLVDPHQRKVALGVGLSFILAGT